MINNPNEIEMKITYRKFNDSIDTLRFTERIASIKFVNGFVLQITVKDGKLFYEFEDVYTEGEI